MPGQPSLKLRRTFSPCSKITLCHLSINSQFSVNLSRDYAMRRRAFGQLVSNHPLHLNTLLTLETNVRGCTILMLELARLMGLVEAGAASEQDMMVLRVMMPVAKAFTAKHAMHNISEGLECFGGQVCHDLWFDTTANFTNNIFKSVGVH